MTQFLYITDAYDYVRQITLSGTEASHTGDTNSVKFDSGWVDLAAEASDDTTVYRLIPQLKSSDGGTIVEILRAAMHLGVDPA